MTKILENTHAIVWGVPALVLILGVGLYLSVRTRFAQLRFFPKALRLFVKRLFGKEKSEGVSSFQALCTALAATVGTGNLAGVAGAIAIGGPGSIFWMWICALLGMVTKYAEATLAVHFQVIHKDGSISGGPMHMIACGLGPKWKPLAYLYCFFGIVAAFGVGNCTQINAVVSGINGVIGIFGRSESFYGNLTMGVILGIMVVSMLLGGAKRIGMIAEKLVPFAAGAYIFLAFGVLILRFERIPDAFIQILQGAFSPRAVTGGVIGSVFLSLRVGVSRGVFTNEAGMGTASIAHGGTKVKHPAEQGLMGIMEVFLDTIVICTLTALVILVSGVSIPYGQDEGLLLTTRAFASVYGDWVTIVIAAETCCFAFATVLGWGLYGARCAQFLFGEDAWKRFAWLQGVTVVLGAVLNTGTVWLISETVNGLMTLPNLITLFLLTPVLVRLTNEFYPGRSTAKGGTYEYFHQCQPLRTLSHAKVSSAGCQGKGSGKDHLSS